jgi:hypothetical protein
MGETKEIRKKLKSYERVIRAHEDKMAEERRKPNPNEKRIHHWEIEIKACAQTIKRLERRLKVRRQRG